MKRSRYSECDGRQAFADIEADDVLNEAVDDLLQHGDLSWPRPIPGRGGVPMARKLTEVVLTTLQGGVTSSFTHRQEDSGPPSKTVADVGISE
jgi:hypothetical protein